MKIIVLFLIALSFVPMKAQDLRKHQWKQRIIVVSSPAFGNTQARQQLEVLQNELAALKDRKLIVYHVTNSGYTVDFDEDIKISANKVSTISNFQVVLIGLDGGEKFRATDIQKAEKFFDLIDAMPMRRAEIKNKKDE
ncbi:MAG TPA: DUF4174 domain-containing protein [Flavobacteriaceae bacterium]|nr:hypothetical protein [Flavobacteriaceae bacterium]HIB46830.1 DUF4174 domain-containing protein [Flavobacteriaceae bacterium]HIN99975.1 DUF4174 domain-containing protein [Flavobacteriaceae bacterium]